MPRPYSKDLERFLANAFLIERPDGRCIRLCLRHVVMKGQGGDVNNYNIGEADKITEEFLESLQRGIETDAETDASGMGGLQKYQLLPFYSEYPDKALGRLLFREGDPATEEEDNASEPANEKGLLSQLMRHNEAIMRSQVQSANNMLSLMGQTVQKLATEKEALIKDRFDNMQVMERLLSAGHERSLMDRKADFDEKMKQEVGQKIMLLAPALINKLAGKNVLPEAVRPQDVMLKSFMESITEDQFKTLQSIFKPEQMIVVIEMMKSAAGEEPKDKD